MSAHSGSGLLRDALGLREVLFQSTTAVAPALAASIPSGAAFASGSLPLPVLVSVVFAVLLTSSAGSDNTLSALGTSNAKQSRLGVASAHPEPGRACAAGSKAAAAPS